MEDPGFFIFIFLGESLALLQKKYRRKVFSGNPKASLV